MPTTPSSLIPTGVILLSLGLAFLFLLAVRRVTPERTTKSAGVLAAWMAGTGALAAAGALTFSTMPPTMLIFFVVLLAATARLAFGPLGARLAHGLPLTALVGYQAFRIPVELWLHRGYAEGVFPVQMTYSGLNFDILSGVSALVLAGLIAGGWAGRRTVLAWNVAGLGLLATIVTIAILSAPLPFLDAFPEGPENTYVTGFPGVWLPAVLVQGALLGHLLVFRRLLGTRTADS